MSVIVTDMEMPSGCWCCEFSKIWDNESSLCKRKPMEPPVGNCEKRPLWCPLKEQAAQKFFVDESGKMTPLPAVKPQKIKLEERKVLEDDSYDEPVYSIDKFFYCPRCDEILGRTNKDHNIHFCYNCGQAVEWD